ncbi:hypothetical protein MASR2M50_32470 [Thauera sp.]
MRQPFAPDQLDEVILGCASPSADEVNIGRVVALRLGCGNRVPGWTVMRNCASGMQAIDSAIANLQCGRSQLVLAGGVDALSHAPLLFSEKMVRWLAGWYAARSTGDRLAMLKTFRLGHLAPVIGIMKGLTDPIVGQLMGQTAENLAWKFGITREDMDAFAVESHRRVCAGQDAGHYADEIVPLIDRDGEVHAADDGVRRDSSMANLAKLKPFFDKKYGRVTPGNSSQITDGAAWLVLASEEAVERHGLKPLGRIVDSQWAGLAPDQMGLGSGARHDADPAAPRPGAQRSRRLGAQRGLRRAGHRLPARLRGRRLLPHALRRGCAGRARGVTAQRGWRRGRARPPGRRERRAHRAASARSAAPQGWRARPGDHLHRRRAGRGDAGGDGVMSANMQQDWKHWRLRREDTGLAWLELDKADSERERAVVRGDERIRRACSTRSTPRRPRRW